MHCWDKQDLWRCLTKFCILISKAKCRQFLESCPRTTAANWPQTMWPVPALSLSHVSCRSAKNTNQRWESEASFTQTLGKLIDRQRIGWWSAGFWFDTNVRLRFFCAQIVAYYPVTQFVLQPCLMRFVFCFCFIKTSFLRYNFLKRCGFVCLVSRFSALVLRMQIKCNKRNNYFASLCGAQ